MLLALFPVAWTEQARLDLMTCAAPPSTPLERALFYAHRQQIAEARAELNRAEDEAGTGATETSDVLLQAALRVCTGAVDAGRALAWSLLPATHGDRVCAVLLHLIVAEAGLREGQPEVAGYAAARAVQLAVSPATRRLLGPALCVWATALAGQGDTVRGLAQAQRAGRLDRRGFAGYLAHCTLADLHLEHQPYQAMEQAQLAAGLALTPGLTAAALARVARAYDRLREPTRPAGLPGSPPAPSPVHLRLLHAPGLQAGARSIDLRRQPRVVLLLCYALQHPGASLVEVAEQLLPEQPVGREQHLDEHHRVARIRQTVARARDLLGDPAAVVVRGSGVFLGPHYQWTSDLNGLLQQGGPLPAVWPPGVQCDWLDALRFSLG
jgi:hypothetical protein